MRKRKSPIVLVTALAVIVVTVAGLQYAWSKTNGPESAPAPQEVADAKPVGDSRPGQTAADTKASIQGALQASKPAAPEAPEGGPAGPPGMNSGPLILNPSRAAKPEKPKPNSSSTSAQWYNDESMMAKDKD